MTNQPQEDLLGFALGALDADQRERLQEKLDSDNQLEEKLLEIKSGLTPLELLEEPTGLRPGLARRTCEMVACYQNDRDVPENSPAYFRSGIGERPETSGTWSRSDVLFAVGAVGILASLLFPVISYTKQQSQIAHCASNLGQIGVAVESYADIQNEDLEIPLCGPLAIVGSFAPILNDNLLIDDIMVFYCPAVQRNSPCHIPSCKEIQDSWGTDEYPVLCKNASGDLGYSLGFVENDCFHSPHCCPKSNRILCADKPSACFVSGPSSNHGGKGQNCVFEDGHVQYVVGSARGEDLIYVNLYNIVGPGIGRCDSVIGASHMRPRHSCEGLGRCNGHTVSDPPVTNP